MNIKKNHKILVYSRIAGEPYAFVDPKKLTSKEDESKYLKSSDTPINLDDLPF